MGLFKEEHCSICNADIGISAGAKLKTGEKICKNCIGKMNLTLGFNIENVKASTIEQLKERIEFAQKDLEENRERIKRFTPTYQIDNTIWFDDNNKLIAIPHSSGFMKYSIENSYMFPYNCIVGYELIENGTTVTENKGGLGRAVAGGILFGGVGAIVGASTSKSTTQELCNDLKVKVTTNNNNRPFFDIVLLITSCSKSAYTYKEAFEKAHQIMSKFQAITNELKNKSENQISNTSVADEIKKYKELLDIGAITQEEFDTKKKELLNM